MDERRGGQSAKDRGAKRAKKTTDAKEPWSTGAEVDCGRRVMWVKVGFGGGGPLGTWPRRVLVEAEPSRQDQEPRAKSHQLGVLVEDYVPACVCARVCVSACVWSV